MSNQSGLSIEELKKGIQEKITDLETRQALLTLELTSLKIKFSQLDRLIKNQTT